MRKIASSEYCYAVCCVCKTAVNASIRHSPGCARCQASKPDLALHSWVCGGRLTHQLVVLDRRHPGRVRIRQQLLVVVLIPPQRDGAVLVERVQLQRPETHCVDRLTP